MFLVQNSGVLRTRAVSTVSHPSEATDGTSRAAGVWRSWVGWMFPGPTVAKTVGAGKVVDMKREPFADTELTAVWHAFRVPVVYATILTGVTLGVVWQWTEGFVLAGLAGVAGVEARYRLRHPGSSPLSSILLDTTMIGAAMFLARVPSAAIGVPFVYLGVTALMLLSAREATWVFGYAVGWLGLILSAPGLLNRPSLDGTQGLIVGAVASVIFATFAFAEIWVLSGALRRFFESLQRLVRSKDEFIASVSHELRTPLTAVVGFAQQLDEDQDRFTSQERAEMIGFVYQQSAEVARLVEDLLVAARADIGTLTIVPTRIDLRHLIGSVVDNHSRTHGLEIALSADDRPVTVWADPNRVRQILHNLLINAIRYGGSNHRITLTTDAQQVLIQVRDNGPAIDPTDQDRIFEPYERAHQESSQPASVGLGLAVSRTLARLMDGDLTYKHEHDESIFQLALPAPQTTM